MRLIDADAAIKEIERQAGCAECDNYNGIRCRACSWDDARGLVDDFADNHPVTDRPEIVFCKDCMYCEYPDAEKEMCKKGHIYRHGATWFCADGKRKKETE